MKVKIEIGSKTLRKLVLDHIQQAMGEGVIVAEENVVILVKTKQNYKAEWESGDFKAIIERDIP